jgi:hypothetical protein
MRLAALPGGALKLDTDCVDQPAMVVRDDPIPPREPSAFKPGKEAHPAPLALTIPNLQAQDLAVALLAHSGRPQRAHCPHPPTFTDFEDERIHQHKRVALPTQVALIPRRDKGIQALTQIRDGRFGKARATQLFGDPGHLARRDAIDHHLHERQHQRLFAALIAGK